MVLKLYYIDVSPAVRSVLLLAKAINLDLELIVVNLAKGEQLAPEFLKLNPLHTVPTLDDDGFVICDSHAINAYLVGKYAKDDSLYRNDLQVRARIDVVLHFDSGVLFPKLIAITRSLFAEGVRTISKDKEIAVLEGYKLLETLLNGKKYTIGDSLSIADFHVVTTVSSLNVLVPIAENRFPNICQFLTLMKTLPYYNEGNQVGLEKFTVAMKSLMS